MADYREEQNRVREELALHLASLQKEQKLRYTLVPTCMTDLYIN